jgi:uncharacterized protein YlxP (DUF503 family)
MVVGVLRLTLYIHGASSLKDKRQVVRKVTDRLRSRFNVSVAEVGENDVWQRAVIGISAIANDHSFVNEVLDKCARDAGNIAEIVNREMEIETWSQMSADWSQKPEFEAHDLSRLPPERDDEELPEEAAEGGWLKEEDLK